VADDRLTTYAEWLVANENQKGSEQFNTVAGAYRLLRKNEQPSEPSTLGSKYATVNYDAQEEDSGTSIPGYVVETGKSLLGGATSTGGLAALGSSFLLPEGAEQAVRDPLVSAGDTVDEFFSPNEAYEDNMFLKLMHGLGSTAPFIATGVAAGSAAGPLGMGVGAIAGGLLGVAVGAGEAAMRAIDAGASEEDISKAAMLGMGPGFLESIPPGRIAKSALRVAGPEAADKIGKELSTGIMAKVANWTKQARTGRMTQAALEEGVQEAISEVGQNLIAQGIYDPEQGAFTGTGESFGYGAGVGGLLQGLTELALGRSARRGSGTDEEQTAEPEVKVEEQTAKPEVTVETPVETGATNLEGTIEETDLFGRVEAGTTLTAVDVEELGIKAQSPTAGKLAGLDLTNPTQIDSARKMLTTYRNNSAVRKHNPAAVANVNRLLALPIFTQDAAATADVEAMIAEDTAVTPEDAPQQVDLFEDAEETAGIEALIAEEESATEQAAQERDTLEAESDLESAEGRVEGTRQRDTVAGRRAILDEVLALEGITDVAGAFSAELGRQGYTDTTVTEEELASIQRRADVQQAVDVDDAATEADAAESTRILEEALYGSPVTPKEPATETEQQMDGFLQAAKAAQAAEEAGQVLTPEQEASLERAKAAADYIAGNPNWMNIPAPGTPERASYDKAFTAQEAVDAGAVVEQEVAAEDTPALSDADKNVIAAQQIAASREDPEKVKSKYTPETAVRSIMRGPDYEGSVGEQPISIDQLMRSIAFESVKDPSGLKNQKNPLKRGKAAVKWVRSELSADANKLLDQYIEVAERLASKTKQSDAERIAKDNFKPAGPSSLAGAYNKEAEAATDKTVEQATKAVIKERQDLIDLNDGTTTDDIDVIIGERQAGEEFLKTNAVAATMQPASAEVTAAVNKNNLSGALTQIANDTNNKRVKATATVLARMVKSIETLKVVMVDGSADTAGSYLHGTTEIQLNKNVPLNTHTVLHEAAHAVTQAGINNKSAGPTKQLQKLMEEVREHLERTGLPLPYGIESLSDFVAEAYTNPEFQSLLASIKPETQPLTGWQKFIRAIAQRLGIMKPPVNPNYDQKVMAYVNVLLSATPEARNATVISQLVAEGKPEEALMQMRSGGKALASRETIQDTLTYYANRLRSGGELLRNGALNGLSMIHLVDMAKKFNYHNEANRLEELVLLQDGSRNELTKQDKELVSLLTKAFDGDLDAQKTFSLLTIRASENEVDPAKEQARYERYWYNYITIGGDIVEKSYATKAERDTAAANIDRAGVANNKVHKVDASDEKVQIHKTLRRMFEDKLNDQQRHAYVALRDSYVQKNKAVIKTISSRLDTMVGDKEIQVSLRNKIFGRIMMNGVIDPYFPMDRQGKFWLEYNYGPDNTYATHSFANNAERKTAMDKLRDDPAVNQESLKLRSATDVNKASFGEGASTALINDIQKELNKVRIPKNADGTDAAGAESVAAMKKKINDLLFRTLPEQALLQTRKGRKGIPGFETNPIQAFEDRSKIMVNSYVNLLFEPQLVTTGAALREKSRAAGYSDDSLAHYLSLALAGTKAETDAQGLTLPSYMEFAKNPQISKGARNLRAATFGWTLLANVSAPVVNAIALPFVVYSRLAADYGGVAAAKAMGSTMADYARTWGKVDVRDLPGLSTDYVETEGGAGAADGTSTRWGGFSFANNKEDPAYKTMRPLIDRLIDIGLDERTIASDAAELDATTSKTAQKVLHYGGILFNHSERAVRQIAAGTTYKLEMEKQTGKKYEDLTEDDIAKYGPDAAIVATSSMERLNASALMTTAPRAFQNNVGSVMGQFKRFPINVAALQSFMTVKMFRGVKDAYNGRISELEKQIAESTDELQTHKLQAELATAQEARVDSIKAMQNMAYMAGLGYLMLGVKGVPGWGILATLYNLFTDDDEDDFNTMVAKNMSSGMYFGALAEMGIDITDRASLTNLIIRDPGNYVADSNLEYMVDLIAGPAVGIGKRVWDGGEMLLDGKANQMRAAERILPSSFANIVKGVRFSKEGLRTTRGDLMIPDVTPGSIIWQSLGFRPIEHRMAQDKMSRNYRVTRGEADKKKALLDRYWEYEKRRVDGGAVDPSDMDRIIRDMRKFSERYPTRPITDSTLASSMKTRFNNSQIAKLTGGMVIGEASLLDIVMSNDAMYR
jgi:hypothetical protein